VDVRAANPNRVDADANLAWGEDGGDRLLDRESALAVEDEPAHALNLYDGVPSVQRFVRYAV